MSRQTPSGIVSHYCLLRQVAPTPPTLSSYQPPLSKVHRSAVSIGQHSSRQAPIPGRIRTSCSHSLHRASPPRLSCSMQFPQSQQSGAHWSFLAASFYPSFIAFHFAPAHIAGGWYCQQRTDPRSPAIHIHPPHSYITLHSIILSFQQPSSPRASS